MQGSSRASSDDAIDVMITIREREYFPDLYQGLLRVARSSYDEFQARWGASRTLGSCPGTCYGYKSCFNCIRSLFTMLQFYLPTEKYNMLGHLMTDTLWKS